jgi:hypothetical protein
MQVPSNSPSVSFSGSAVAPGEAYLAEAPVLRAHAGTQPDLFLRWNAVPKAAAAVDIVVHLHGFSQQGGDMALAEKVPRSGLDLSRRSRPTLALLPRGNWIRRTYYDFPALLAGGLDRLIDYGVEQFTRAAGLSRLDIDRLILTAHSGGGMPAIDAVAGAARRPDELHIFDGLYGRDPSLGDPMQGIEVLERWLEERIVREPDRPGVLRVVYIERQTGPFSRAAAELIAKHLRPLEPTLAAELARRYRVELSGVPHGYVAAVCGPELLADPVRRSRLEAADLGRRVRLRDTGAGSRREASDAGCA